MGYVYIYCLERPLGRPQSRAQRLAHGLPPREEPYRHPHAKHYLGSAVDMATRHQQHLHGGAHAARLLRVAKEEGVRFRLARVWVTDDGRERELEKMIKAQHNTPRYCPLCNETPYSVPDDCAVEIEPEAAILPW